MVLILDRVTAVIIRIKAIKILRSKAWVDNSVAAHGACSICPLQLLVAACLYVEPMRSCAKLGYDTSEVSVASLLNVWLASIAELDASVHCRLARSLHIQLLHMLTLGRLKRKDFVLWMILCWAWDQVVLQPCLKKEPL